MRVPKPWQAKHVESINLNASVVVVVDVLAPSLQAVIVRSQCRRSSSVAWHIICILALLFNEFSGSNNKRNLMNSFVFQRFLHCIPAYTLKQIEIYSRFTNF